MELGIYPNIVRCYRIFRADIGMELFFVLELVASAKGKRDASLRSWLIPGKSLPVERALLFAFHICCGMTYATQKIHGFVHRDLKPENILISRDERAQVTDFGLASASKQQIIDLPEDNNYPSQHKRTQLIRGIAGTPHYIAPEQWTDESLDERADIYAFGCILYEMLCGSFVVTGKTPEELKNAYCQGNLKDIPSILPSPIGKLLRKCLATNQKNRYPCWVELGKDVIEVYHIISGKKISETKTNADEKKIERIADGWSYNVMGVSYCDISKHKVTRKYFEWARKIARSEQDHKLEGATLGNLGNSYSWNNT